MEFLFGADPEIFVQRGNKNMSAYGLVPGTKENPHNVNRGAVQVDGMALEFNIIPSKNVLEFQYNINTVLKQLKNMIPQDLKFSQKSSVTFSDEVLNTQPVDALRLGCEPDFNAWYNGEQNPAPRPGRKGFRTASGHLHIGWTQVKDPTSAEHMDACIRLIQQLDCSLGMASILLDTKGNKRRELYGRAGAFRPKNYGVEYRVLSNFWIMKEEYIKLIYKLTEKSIQDLINGKEYIYMLPSKYIVPKIINLGIDHRAYDILRCLQLIDTVLYYEK